MKRTLLSAFLLIACPIIAQQSLTLQQAIDFAIANAPSFQNNKIDQQIQDAKKLESVSNYLPKINATAEYKDNLSLALSQIPAEVFGGTPGEYKQVRFGVKYNSTAGLDLNQPILDAAAIGDILYAKKGQLLTAYQYEQALIDLKVNVTKAYYSASLNFEKLQRSNITVERNQRVYEDTKVKFDNEQAIRTDLNKALLNWKQAQYQQQLANDNFSQAKLLLLQYIGADINQTIQLADALPKKINTDTLLLAADVLNISTSRIEYKIESQQSVLNQWQLKKTYLQYAPTLSFFGYYGGQGFSSDANVFNKQWNQVAYLGVRLNMPVFDGLQKVAIAQQQKLNLLKNTNNLTNLRQTVNYQLKSSALNLANTARNVHIQQQNLQLAEDILTDVRVRFDNALATYQEVIDAQKSIQDAEILYFNALYDYLVADIDWKKANGNI